jgi:hypothetical protein
VPATLELVEQAVKKEQEALRARSPDDRMRALGRLAPSNPATWIGIGRGAKGSTALSAAARYGLYGKGYGDAGCHDR